jgi:MFS family permease
MSVPATASVLRIPNIRLFLAFRVLFNARFYYPIFTILFLDFGLTLEQFSLLNAAWAATILCAEVPSGALADRWGRRRLVRLAGVFMVLEILLLCLTPGGVSPWLFWIFLLNRILSGAAEVVLIFTTAPALSSTNSVKSGRPRAWVAWLQTSSIIKLVESSAAHIKEIELVDCLAATTEGVFGIEQLP